MAGYTTDLTDAHWAQLQCVWAAGGLLTATAVPLGCQLLIVQKPAGQMTVAVLPRRWFVERPSAWLSHYRRLGTRA